MSKSSFEDLAKDLKNIRNTLARVSNSVDMWIVALSAEDAKKSGKKLRDVHTPDKKPQ